MIREILTIVGVPTAFVTLTIWDVVSRCGGLTPFMDFLSQCHGLG